MALSKEVVAARLAKTDLAENLKSRFLKYVQIDSQSNPDGEGCPSTPCQHEMARVMVDELKAIGVTNVKLYETAHVIGTIPATPGFEHSTPLVLMSHIDTASDCPGSGVKPVVTKADNGDIIIASDGTTLLGADDKAGIAEIMVAMEVVIKSAIPHGLIEVVFTPDEETSIGCGYLKADDLVGRLGYTVDGSAEPVLEDSCFFAAAARVKVTGVAKHPGYARGVLVNAVLVASTLALALPRTEAPETTDGDEGYYSAMKVEGTVEAASVQIILRDFAREGLERRCEVVKKLAAGVEAQFPGAKIEVTISHSYGNFHEILQKNPLVMEAAVAACKAVGITPVVHKIRGGTDESSLQTAGFALANLFTGGIDYHSRKETVNLATMVGTTEVLIEIVKRFAAAQQGK
jgi:tripeptide aminopeptidase